MPSFSDLPVNVRRVLYWALLIGGLGLGAMQVWYGNSDPTWLDKTMNVFSFVSAGVGGVAGIHTVTKKDTKGDKSNATDDDAQSASDDAGAESSQTPTPKRAEVPSSASTTPSVDAPASANDGEIIDISQLPEPDGGDSKGDEVISDNPPASTGIASGI